MFKMVCTTNAKNLFDLKPAQNLSLRIGNIIVFCLGGEKCTRKDIVKT